MAAERRRGSRDVGVLRSEPSRVSLERRWRFRGGAARVALGVLRRRALGCVNGGPVVAQEAARPGWRRDSARMPTAVGAEDADIAESTGVADAVEELQDLDGAFAAEADDVAILSGFDGTVVLGQRGHHRR